MHSFWSTAQTPNLQFKRDSKTLHDDSKALVRVMFFPGGSVTHLAAQWTAGSWYLRQVLKHGGDPNLENPNDRFLHPTPLLCSLSTLQIENAKLLIAAGANVNWRHPATGLTVLEKAGQLNRYDFVYELLVAGAVPTAKDKWGHSLVYFIQGQSLRMDRENPLWQWREKVVDLLRAKGVDLGRIEPGISPIPASDQVTISTTDAIAGAAARAEGVTGLFEFKIQGGGHQDGWLYLNSERDYRDQRCLTVAVPPNLAAELQDSLRGDPAVLLVGRSLRVTGTAKKVTVWFYLRGIKTDKYSYQTHVAIADLSQLYFLPLGGIDQSPPAMPERTTTADRGAAVQRRPLGRQIEVQPKGEYAKIDTSSIFRDMKVFAGHDAAEKDALVNKIRDHPGDYAPPVYMLMARRLYETGDAENAYFWFSFGRLRGQYDAARCADLSARDGIDVMVMNLDPELRRFPAKMKPDDIVPFARRVVKLDSDTPYNYDHRWLNLHGLGVFIGGQREFSLPQSQWPDLLKKGREEYLKGAEDMAAQLKSPKKN